MPPKSAKQHPDTEALLPQYITTIPNPKKLTSATTHEAYTGEVDADNKRSGMGALLWPNGNCYMGEWKNGTMDGKGTFLYAVEGDKYYGDFVDDKKHGAGTYTFANGNYFQGGFDGDKRHGTGKYVWTCGDSYEGGWRDGHMEGKGTTLYSNGNRYDGDFIHDRREGFGRLTCADGLSYEGDWLKNMRHGKGTLTFPNGDVYVGDWQNDKKHGQGVDTFINGNRYEGEYKENLKDGEGTMTYANGDCYQGQWQKDKMHGAVGRYLFAASGYYYFGEWKDNVREGKGKYLYPDGSVFDGEWAKDKKHGKGSLYAKNMVEPAAVGLTETLVTSTYTHGVDLVYDGTWVNGKMHGHFTATGSQGATPPVEFATNVERDTYITVNVPSSITKGPSIFDGDWQDGEIKKGTYVFSGPNTTGTLSGTFSAAQSRDDDSAPQIAVKGGDQMIPAISDKLLGVAQTLKQLPSIIPKLSFGVEPRSLGLDTLFPPFATNKALESNNSQPLKSKGLTSRSNSASLKKGAQPPAADPKKRKSVANNNLGSSSRRTSPPPVPSVGGSKSLSSSIREKCSESNATDVVVAPKIDTILVEAVKNDIGPKALADAENALKILTQQEQATTEMLQTEINVLEAHLSNPDTVKKLQDYVRRKRAAATGSASTGIGDEDNTHNELVAAMQQEIETLKTKKATLEDTLKNRRDTIAEQQRLAALRKEYDQMKMKNADLTSVNDKLALQVEEQKGKVDVQAARIASAQEKGSNIASLKESVIAAEKQIEQLKKSNEKLGVEAAKSKRLSLQNKSNAKKKQTELLDGIIAIEKEIKFYSDKVSANAEKDEQRRNNDSNHEKEVVELERFQKQLETQKADLKSHFSSLSQKAESIEAEKERFVTTSERVISKGKERDELQKRFEAVKKEITLIHETLEKGQRQRDDELLNAQGQLATAEATLAAAVAKTQQSATVGRLRKKKSLIGDSSLGEYLSGSTSTSFLLQHSLTSPNESEDTEAEKTELEKRASLLKARLDEMKKKQSDTDSRVRHAEAKVAELKASDKDADNARRIEGASKEVLFNQLTKLRTAQSKLTKEKEKLFERKEQIERELEEDSNDGAYRCIEAANRIIATIKPDEWKLIYLRNQLEQRAKTISELQREVARIPSLEAQLNALRSEMPNQKY